MKVISFDLKGKIGHYRRPDTTGAHLSYPIITRTVTHGLIASILGLERLDGKAWIGIELHSPVKTRAQELSMLGKGWIGGGKESFNRPTSIELVVSPSYRIYYAGDYLETLEEMLVNQKSFYHTYLGSAYCLTFPQFVASSELEVLTPPYPEELNSLTVVPSHCIESLVIDEGAKYGRVGGMHYEYLGERKFNGTVNIIYDYDGKQIRFKPKEHQPSGSHPYLFLRFGKEEVICLW